MAPNPIAFSIGPYPVRWYGLLIGLGLVIGVFLAVRECERRGLNPDLLLDTVLWAVPAGILGARLYYVAFEWKYFAQHLNEIFALWQGGLAIHGGLIFGVGTALLYLRRHKAPFLQYLDVAAPSIVLAQAIGRWGNFFNQEAFGTPTLLPWAMLIAGEYRHPTFLYESLWNLGVFVSLVIGRRNKDWVPGEVAMRYLAGYSLGRIWIEGLRTDSLYLGPIRIAQLVSLAGIILGAAGVVWLRRRARVTNLTDGVIVQEGAVAAEQGVPGPDEQPAQQPEISHDEHEETEPRSENNEGKPE